MSNQLVITSGAKVRSLEGVITGSTGVLNSLPINGANGIPQLDSNGKILVSQLPNSVMEYKGTWDAATNTPTLANGTGNQGDVYLCNVAGTVNFGAGPITFYVGDQVIYSGSIWQRASGASGTVTSVAVTESGDALTITGSPITTSGTINIGFAGTSAQYVAGDGSLITFPSTATAAQNLITEVYNETGATLTKGTVVYINGGHGNLPTVTKAIATSDATSAQTYGVVRADITNMNNGFVTVIGSLSDLDTQAYPNGTQLYLSGTTAGAWTSTKPSAPIHLVYVGIVVRSHPTQGVVEVRIQNGYELGELHDVAISSPTNNQGIFYNSSNSLWENKSIATALGYTPANNSLVVHLAGNETITGLKTFNTPVAFDNALNVKFDASITAFGGYYSIYAIKGVGSGNSTLALYDGDTNKRISLSFYNSSDYTYLFPAASGTVALTSQLTSGTVTSVGLSSSTSGVTIGSSPVTTSGTITLSIATASGSQQGLLSSTDWTTFNSKQGAITLTTTGTSGAATLVGNTLNIPQYQAAGTYVTSVTGTSPIVSSGGTTPAISINQATTSTDGYLSSTDWNTFNNKQNALTNPVTGTGTSGQVTYFNGTSSVTGSNNLKFDGTNLLIGNPSSALAQLYVYNASAAASFLLKTNSSTDYSEIAVRNYNDTSTSYFRQYSSSASGSDFGISRANLALFFSNYASNFAIGTRNGGDLILGTADTERARLLASNGYFGIGTSSPSYLLDVNGTGRFTGALTGTSATFSSRVNVNGAPDDADIGMTVKAPSGSGKFIMFGRDASNIAVYSLSSAGAATFSSSVTAGGISASSWQNIYYVPFEIGNTNSRVFVTGRTDSTIAGDIGINAYYNGGWKYTNTGVANEILIDGGFHFRTAPSGTAGAALSWTDAMYITNGGNVGIGTTSPSSLLHIAGANGVIANFVGASGNYGQIYSDANAAIFGASTATTLGNDYLYINPTSHFQAFVTNGGERMRITSGGKLLVGATSDAGNGKIQVTGDVLTTGSTGGYIFADRSNNSYLYTWYATGNTTIYLYSSLTSGNIVSINPSTGAYTALSDINKKKDFEDSTIGLSAILGLKPTLYRMKTDSENSNKYLGFIAQEVKEFIPQAYVEKDDFIGLQDRPIIAALVKAIQEIVDKYDNKISILEAQIEELKAKIK
jgi:hypothetical protein